MKVASGRSTPLAPGTPSLGPSVPGWGPRPEHGQGGGSVSGTPWQLVEVDNRRASADSRRGTWSQGSSPGITLLKSPLIQPSRTPSIGRSPLIQPRSPPTQLRSPPMQLRNSQLLVPHHVTSWSDDDLSNYSARSGERRIASDRRSFLRGQRRSRTDSFRATSAGASCSRAANDDDDGFDPDIFVGDWVDGLGHKINVVRAESNRRRQGRLTFLATLQRVQGGPDKKFNITKTRGRTEWSCGNGQLVRSESSMELVTWQTEDGRVSTWKRPMPEGAVHFDDVPGDENWRSDAMEWQRSNPPLPGPLEPPVYFDPPPMESQWTSQGDSGVYFWVGTDGSMIPVCNDGSTEWTADSDVQNAEGQVFTGFSAAATEFVPGQGLASDQAPGGGAEKSEEGNFKIATPTDCQSPAAGPKPSPGGEDSAEIFLSKETPDVRVVGRRLEWTLADPWGKLNRFPKDFCITSPMFGISRVTNMQLVFYPNGSRTAEAGHCTVALTRGPDSAGIKFEFFVNGTASGPKKCLGGRFLGDYPKPFGDTEGQKGEKIVLAMHVLEVMGGPG